MAVGQTGIFYAQHGVAPIGEFPREFRSRAFSEIEPRFAILFAALFLTIGGTVFTLSFRKPSSIVTEKQMLKMQERYASLVLNQPKQVQKPVEEKKATASESSAGRNADKEAKKIDRKNETYAEREARKASTASSREAQREKISKEVGSAGIFAAITSASGASGSSGSSSAVTDLLGATDVAVSGLAGVSVSKGSFAVAKVDAAALASRSGNRTTGVGIATAGAGTATAQQIASAGDVNMSSAPPTISGDQNQVQTSQACIQHVITSESSKIKRVFETWLKRDPQLGGRIKVKFTILPNGSVVNVAVLQSTTGNGRFDETVTRFISQWVFTDCKMGSPLEIELPFMFEGTK